MFERVKSWWSRRRLAWIDRRTVGSDNRSIRLLRAEVVKRTREWHERCESIKSDASAAGELASETIAELRRVVGERENEIERLQRQLSLAEMEIDHLGSVLARDRSRLTMEAAIFERKAAGLERAISAGEMID